MFAIVVIALLILIAFGVLLITEAGKAILRSIGWLALIGAVLFALFWLIVFGYVFFHSPGAEAQVNAFGSGIGVILLCLCLGGFIWLTFSFFRDLLREKPRVFSWQERKEMRYRLNRFLVKHSAAIGGLIFLWLGSLMFLGILPEPWQNTVFPILGWPFFAILIIVIVFAALGRSRSTAPTHQRHVDS